VKCSRDESYVEGQGARLSTTSFGRRQKQSRGRRTTHTAFLGFDFRVEDGVVGGPEFVDSHACANGEIDS
jgi:hypothetical protein